LRRYKVDLSLLAPLVGYSFNYDRPPALVVAADPDFFINYRNYQPQLPVITVHLGASVPARLWPLPYWIKLLSLLVGRYNIAVIGGLSEQSNFNQLPPELKDKIMNFLGRSWQETAQTLKNSSVFIGANSGPAHLAAAVGCPVISIFSAANDPVEWAPEQAKVLIFAPACAGCERLVCSDPHCLKNITPAQVLVELETFNLLVQVK
jgi:ADP-heptose:LPS heptosyltransferase